MNVLINKKFLDELIAIPIQQRKHIEQFVFKEILEFNNLQNIPYLKKLKGYKNYYRIRFGNYRVGISYTKDTIVFERVLHRKDIYKFFP